MGGVMARFEEVQMRLAESAKNYLELLNMQVFIEQFTLDRESVMTMTLPDLDPPFPLTTSLSFTFDAFQTGMSVLEEPETERHNSDIDTSIELEIVIQLPIMSNTPNLDAMIREIEEEYPDAEPVLVVKDVLSREDPFREYEITYTYSIEEDDILDQDLLNEVFGELHGILEITYRWTKSFIDMSWYRENDDPFKRN